MAIAVGRPGLRGGSTRQQCDAVAVRLTGRLRVQVTVRSCSSVSRRALRRIKAKTGGGGGRNVVGAAAAASTVRRSK